MRPRIYQTTEEAKEANRTKTRELKRRLRQGKPRPQYIFLLENPTGQNIQPTPSPAKGWQAVDVSTAQSQALSTSRLVAQPSLVVRRDLVLGTKGLTILITTEAL